MEAIQSQYSLEDLEQFRDEEGFINLTEAGIEFNMQSREIEGNPNRGKNWINFNGINVLIKGEAILDKEPNYGIYAELIAEEISKHYGRGTAHYDLVKYKDENGNEVRGVLSESVIDRDRQQLYTLRDLIGDEPVEQGDFVDTTSLKFTVEQLQERLSKDNFDEETIQNLITEYKKDLLFYSIYLMDVDKHIENIAFVVEQKDGEKTISLSKNYDSEAILMLDNDISSIHEILNGDISGLKIAVEEAHPRIGTLKSIEEGGLNSYWMDTLEDLCNDDEIYDYATELISSELDLTDIFDRVEERIGAKIPQEAKDIARYAFSERTTQMDKVLIGEIELPGQQESELGDFLGALINKSKEEGIRTGEQVDVGQQIEKDIKSPKVDLTSMLNQLFSTGSERG